MSCAIRSQHVRGRALGLLGMLEPQPHAADVRFVGDVVGQDLDHAGAVLGDDAACAKRPTSSGFAAIAVGTTGMP